jgi:hypothetical protein
VGLTADEIRDDPTWTILIPTLQRRESRFTVLRDELLRQTESYGGLVRVCALWNRGQRPLGELRQALVTYVLSDYVSFVDDDDEVPAYFVEEVVRALESWPDQVGWRMQCIRDGAMLKPTFHSIKYGSWWEDDAGYYRDVSHLNPVRHTLALQCDFRLGDPPEDVAWVSQMRRLVRTEQMVSDRVMYYYRSSSVDSTWQLGSVSPPTSEELAAEPPYVAHPHFFYHPRSYRPNNLGVSCPIES